MALPKLFTRIFWHNDTTPALNEDNLNAMSKGLSDVDDRVIELAGTIMEDLPRVEELVEEAQALLDDLTIEDLKDTSITNPSDGDALVYNSTTQKWENGAADMGLFVQNGILMCRYEIA